MKNIKVNFNEIIGKIKPMHGVGQPPFIGMDFSMCDYLEKANIPYSRLHDVGGSFGRNVFVDIPNIFRDFSADPSLPESYDFAFTDELIKALVCRGIEPVFRLGVTIENYREIKPYRIDPPADYKKWAQICEGIIRHYTEGWAMGFEYDIKYWEIWNEPDNYDIPEKNQMWTGTAEDYYRLYEVASKHLKERFPHLKIGGYASCGFYAVTHSETKFGACSSRYMYFVEFFEGFLEYIKKNDCPLDFFSWHSYSGVEENIIRAEFARRRLDEYGYKDTEHTLNEWNWRPDLKGTVKHAALTAAMMLGLHDTTLDSAMFYDARCGMGAYSGMFNCLTYEPFPAYYSFVAFGELYKAGSQVRVEGLPEGVYACAAKDEDGLLVIANTNDSPVEAGIEFSGAETIKECRIIGEKGFEEYTLTDIIPANSVISIKLEIKRSGK